MLDLSLLTHPSCSYVSNAHPDEAEMEREFHVVLDALVDIGFSASEISSVQAVVASVLMLGNLEFDDDSSGQAEVVNKEVRVQPCKQTCLPACMLRLQLTLVCCQGHGCHSCQLGRGSGRLLQGLYHRNQGPPPPSLVSLPHQLPVPHPQVINKERFEKTVQASKASFARDAVAKALYDRLFQ